MTEVFKRTKTYTELISLQGETLSRYERARERISETLARGWEFVIMPNHFHAIIRIGENQFITQRRVAINCVSTPGVELTGDLVMVIKIIIQKRCIRPRGIIPQTH